jgi:drug/metabolite transporter (DMT)-like permease
MRAIVFAVIAGLCWGVGEIFTKSALNTGRVGPFTILLIRSLVTVVPAALAAWYAIGIAKSEPADFATRMGPSVWAMVIGGTGLLAGFAGVFFFYWGLASPGGDISLIRPIAFALSPLTAVVLGWMMLGEPMTLRKAAAVVLIVGGIGLLVGEGHKTSKNRETEKLKVRANG